MKPRIVRLYSGNNDFQRAEVLRRNRHKRRRYCQFFLEGVLPINRALEHEWAIDAFYYAHDRRLSGWAQDILAGSRARTHFELPSHLMAMLSGKEETSELIAVLPVPEDDLSRIPIRQDLLVVVCDRTASPGNLGTTIRSADALGAHGVVVTGHAADVYDPETLSASRGALFGLPVVRVPRSEDLLPWFAQVRDSLGTLQVVGSDEKAEIDLDQQSFLSATVIVVGNETWGMSAHYREICTVMIKIPMAGGATSLNVAAATSIMLYEASIQRRRDGQH